ncbi:MAG: hypothetical protein HC910_06770 [Spirulinaceae cyanobacterium SM2_1_0]|nr:hypothetical protein [Spirulinaceae cyanobacterium SM2_1_0]
MQVWLVSFGLIFAVVELCQWFRQVMLPLPLAIAAGGLLALVSNAESWPRDWLPPLLLPDLDAPALPPLPSPSDQDSSPPT